MLVRSRSHDYPEVPAAYVRQEVPPEVKAVPTDDSGHYRQPEVAVATRSQVMELREPEGSRGDAVVMRAEDGRHPDSVTRSEYF
nr:hypothetical protein BaRGS_007919 [Batillaria attramentaria]